MTRTGTLLALLVLQTPAAQAQVDRKKLAGSVVRSEEWVVHRGADTIEEWTNKVSYRNQGREFQADWAERRHTEERWRARGNIRTSWTLADGTVLKARGNEARHEGVGNTGLMKPLSGRMLEFERKLPTEVEPDRGESRELSWDLAKHRILMKGDVRTWGPSGRSWSQQADYDTEKRTLLLTGQRPVLVSGAKDWNGAVQAEIIEANDRPGRVAAQGKVRGWIVFEDGPAAHLKKLR